MKRCLPETVGGDVGVGGGGEDGGEDGDGGDGGGEVGDGGDIGGDGGGEGCKDRDGGGGDTVTIALALLPPLSITRTVELPPVDPALYCPVVVFTLAPLEVFATRLNVYGGVPPPAVNICCPPLARVPEVGLIVTGAVTVTVTVAIAMLPRLSVTRNIELPSVGPAVYCPVVAFTTDPPVVSVTTLYV